MSLSMLKTLAGAPLFSSSGAMLLSGASWAVVRVSNQCTGPGGPVDADVASLPWPRAISGKQVVAVYVTDTEDGVVTPPHLVPPGPYLGGTLDANPYSIDLFDRGGGVWDGGYGYDYQGINLMHNIGPTYHDPSATPNTGTPGSYREKVKIFGPIWGTICTYPSDFFAVETYQLPTDLGWMWDFATLHSYSYHPWDSLFWTYVWNTAPISYTEINLGIGEEYVLPEPAAGPAKADTIPDSVNMYAGVGVVQLFAGKRPRDFPWY